LYFIPAVQIRPRLADGTLQLSQVYTLLILAAAAGVKRLAAAFAGLAADEASEKIHCQAISYAALLSWLKPRVEGITYTGIHRPSWSGAGVATLRHPVPVFMSKSLSWIVAIIPSAELRHSGLRHLKRRG
jgi:hypothetical protein